MNITLEDMRPLLTELAHSQNGDIEDSGDALLLRLPTRKYKNHLGEALLEIVVRLDQGKLLLRCPQVFDLRKFPHWPQLFAACLSVQTVPDSSVQFILIPGPWLGTCIELPLEDGNLTVKQLGMTLLDLYARTDNFYEPLMETAQTGQFTRVNKSLPPVFGETLNAFAVRS